MITFKTFLTEARMAPLYHGTYIPNIFDILVQKQGIKPNTRHEMADLLKTKESKSVTVAPGAFGKGIYLVKGVSASRSINFARGYRGSKGTAVIVLDQQALTQRYEIRPIQYWQSSITPSARYKEKIGKPLDFINGKTNEYEEFIITNENIPVKYITGIIIPQAEANNEVIRFISEMYGSSFIKTF